MFEVVLRFFEPRWSQTAFFMKGSHLGRFHFYIDRKSLVNSLTSCSVSSL